MGGAFSKLWGKLFSKKGMFPRYNIDLTFARQILLEMAVLLQAAPVLALPPYGSIYCINATQLGPTLLEMISSFGTLLKFPD